MKIKIINNEINIEIICDNFKNYVVLYFLLCDVAV